jgi:hypothetical protein
MIVFFCLMLAAASADIEKLTSDVAASGRVVDIAVSPSERVQEQPRIAPGAPPLLAFRYYEGQAHHRFNGTELMLDDAGH